MTDQKTPSKVELIGEERLLTDFTNADRVTFRHETFAGPMSRETERLVFRSREACAVVVYDRSLQQLMLIRQFRVHTHLRGQGWMIELPAGLIDPGETPLEAALREVAEETGYEAADASLIHTFFTAPGATTERIYLFYAEVDGRARVADGLEEEDIETFGVTRDEAARMLADGTICDAKTIIGLQWWLGQ